MAGPEELALSCPYDGTAHRLKAQGTFGAFAFGAIIESKGDKAQGSRLKATKELSFNSFACAVRLLPYAVSIATT